MSRHTLHRRHYRGADGTDLAYGEIGPSDGRTVVLCHGLAAAGRQFDTDAAYFAALGYRVLVPDLRGHGQSGIPAPLGPQSFAISALADDMVAMLEHAGTGRVHWVGNSLGGIVALQLLGGQWSRFASLALFGTAFSLNLPRMLGPLLPGVYRALGRDRLASITAASTTRHKPARPLIANMVRRFDPQVGAAIADHVRRYDLHDNALAFAGPLLVLVGGRDHAVNLALRPSLRRHAGQAGWTVVELPEAGHCANLDASDNWRNTLLEFWSGASAAV